VASLRACASRCVSPGTRSVSDASSAAALTGRCVVAAPACKTSVPWCAPLPCAQ
jgi:hypothetical protein